jgi:uncharacterized protein (TIGR02391 family)
MNHQAIHNKVHEALQRRKDSTGLWGDDWLSIYLGLILQAHHPIDGNAVSEVADLITRREMDGSYFRQGRNLLAGFLAVPFLERLGRDTESTAIAQRADISLRESYALEQTKFSVLNSPEFLYGSSLALNRSRRFGAGSVSILKETLTKKMESLSPSSVSRSCFILAAAILLGVNCRPQIDDFISSVDTASLRIDENIQLLWFFAKFGEQMSNGLPKAHQRVYLARYGAVESALDAQLPAVSFDLVEPSDEGAIITQVYCLTPLELVFLDEIVLSRSFTKGVNVQYLFDQLPLHPAVRDHSAKLFQEGNYPQAVEESFKLIIAEVKVRAGHPKDNKGNELDGVPLMRRVFELSRPILAFSKLKTRPERDIQEGVGNLFVGATQGIRNPVTHVPGHRMNPLEALEQIEFASYLMNTLEKARKVKPYHTTNMYG